MQAGALQPQARWLQQEKCSISEPLAVDDGFADHDVEDLDVGVLHAHAAYVAHTGDCLLNGILDQALAGAEAATLHGHIMAQNRRIDGSRNLGGTARLGAVAHDAAHVAKRSRPSRQSARACHRTAR